MNENISVICSESPKERIPLLLNILQVYGIDEHKKIYMQSFDVGASYYVNHLISLMAKIDFKLVESYMFPIENKLENKKIDSKAFIRALEELRASDIVIRDNKVLQDVSWLNYIFDLANSNPYEVIIVDNFNEFLELSEESMQCIMKRIEKYSKKYNAEVILFVNTEDYGKFLNWKVAKANEPLEFKYDEQNHNILSIDEKGVNNVKKKNR